MDEAAQFEEPSVVNGGKPFIEFFMDEGKTSVGKLVVKDGQLTFEGDVAESAQIFFDNVIEVNRKNLELI